MSVVAYNERYETLAGDGGADIPRPHEPYPPTQDFGDAHDVEELSAYADHLVASGFASRMAVSCSRDRVLHRSYLLQVVTEDGWDRDDGHAYDAEDRYTQRVDVAYDVSAMGYINRSWYDEEVWMNRANAGILLMQPALSGIVSMSMAKSVTLLISDMTSCTGWEVRNGELVREA